MRRMKTMHKYSELNNLDNILLEIANGGAVTAEDIMVLLGVAASTASNALRSGHGRGYLKRRNINKGKKNGGPRYEYDLTFDGRRRVGWIRERLA